MTIPTFDATGKPNGYVLTIWNANEQPELRPDQVYLTAIAPHSQKGPHLHWIRRGLFCCIKGNVRVVLRQPGTRYFDHAPACRCSMCTDTNGKRHPVLVGGEAMPDYKIRYSGEESGYGLIEVPTGVPACIYNDGDEEALVLNLPSPAWSIDAPDEHEVENWNP